MIPIAPDTVRLHTTATPYCVVPDGSVKRSVPLFGSKAVVQPPVPIFSATAVGEGPRNVMVTVLVETGVGVGVGVCPPPPHPIEILVRQASKMNFHKDRAIRLFLLDAQMVAIIPGLRPI